MSSIRVPLLVILSLLAFAANSIFCRMALAESSIDAASFTAVRLVSGGLTLFALCVLFGNPKGKVLTGSWLGALVLFVYAGFFSYAYLYLGAALGALVLFGVVQLTIISYSIKSGKNLRWFEWLGVFVAFLGIVFLILPSVQTPSFLGLLMMIVSGVAWGGYTILGKKSSKALADTAGNFVRSIPFALGLFVLAYSLDHIEITYEGVVYASLSGVFASGLGYAIWYAVLPLISSVFSAAVQLLVPVVAAFLAYIFLAESITFELVVSSVLVLGGVACVAFGGFKKSTN